MVISFHSIPPVHAEVPGDVGPRVHRTSAADARAVPRRRRTGARARRRPPAHGAARTSSNRGETNSLRLTAISTMRMIPPTYSASVNCHPISTQRTRPSSHTRFVEANWKATEVTAEAPFSSSDPARSRSRRRSRKRTRPRGPWPWRPAPGRCPRALPRSDGGGSRPGRSRRWRSRAPVPTRPGTPSRLRPSSR